MLVFSAHLSDASVAVGRQEVGERDGNQRVARLQPDQGVLWRGGHELGRVRGGGDQSRQTLYNDVIM